MPRVKHCPSSASWCRLSPWTVCTSVQTKMRKTLNRYLSIHLKITIHQLHVNNFMQKTPVFPEKGLRRVALVCLSCQRCGAKVPRKTWPHGPIAWGTLQSSEVWGVFQLVPGLCLEAHPWTLCLLHDSSVLHFKWTFPYGDFGTCFCNLEDTGPQRDAGPGVLTQYTGIFQFLLEISDFSIGNKTVVCSKWHLQNLWKGKRKETWLRIQCFFRKSIRKKWPQLMPVE